jgi:signal peptidase II
MHKRLQAVLIACGIFGLDRWTKSLVESGFGVYDTRIVIPGFFNIVYAHNPGVAFGIFSETNSGARTPALIAMSCAAVAILAWMLWRIDRQDAWTGVGLSLIFGGALGNVYDRLRWGTVTDFLDFYAGSWHWYTFNIADAAICCGAGLLILGMLVSQKKEAAA